MDANQNPPSEREWTPHEMEEFFAGYDAVTGLPNGSMAGAWSNNSGSTPTSWIAGLPFYRPSGVIVTAITTPSSGWPIAYYCPICKTTTFMLSIWAEKPRDCDYIRVNEICVSDEDNVAHNIEFTFRDRGLSFAHSTRFKVNP